MPHARLIKPLDLTSFAGVAQTGTMYLSMLHLHRCDKTVQIDP